MRYPFQTAWVCCALLLTACGGGGGGGAGGEPSARSTPNAKLALKSFDPGCSDFLDYAADGLTEEYLQQFYCFADGPCPVFVSGPGIPGANPGEGADSGGPGRVSGTNVQETGVDEADIVKTDANGRLYIVSASRLTILEAFPPEQLADHTLVELDLGANDPNFYAEDLFLDEAQHRVVVLGSSYDGQTSYAISVLIDVSNPAAPTEAARIGVDGYGLTSRRVGSRVHRVSRFDVPRPDWLYSYIPSDPLRARRDAYQAARDAGRESEAASIKAEIRTIIKERLVSFGSAAMLPRVFTQLPGQPRVQGVLGCGALSRPDVTTGLGMAVIDSFNTNGSARATTGVINNAYMVYASANNLYLAQSSGGWFFAPDQADETAVYRLALSGTGSAAYRGMGKIPGSVIGSYAFSEHEGYLRVASTESAFSPGRTETSSRLSILDARGEGEMPEVASVTDLAPGERIQGVRLLGARGFIVTFRQVDPLFALDLADPRQPRLASELKIPGFSSYLAPVGDDYLLTVGRDGTDTGLNGGLSVQLFDVRNLDDIQQAAVLAPSAGSGGSYGAAEYDPHAFSYFPDSENAAAPGTLTLPLTTYGNDPASSFTGFLVVRVAPGTANPLSEAGRIDHEQFLAEGDREFCAPQGGPELFYCFAAYNAAEPRRAVYMQNGEDIVLYTLSTVGVLANDALQPVVNLGARALPYDPPCCYFVDVPGIPGPVVVGGGGGSNGNAGVSL
jgi:hypothetical protein